MRKLFSSGLVVFAGMVSLPLPVSHLPLIISPARTGPTPATQPVEPGADYRDDTRFHSLRRFFAQFDCPAWEYAHVFLEAADDYALDWRLLPSLSWVESSGGKAAPNNNLFGWNSGRAQFPSPAAAIHTVAFRLARTWPYKNKTLDEKLKTYNPNTEYAARVKSVMQQISPTE